MFAACRFVSFFVCFVRSLDFLFFFYFVPNRRFSDSLSGERDGCFVLEKRSVLGVYRSNNVIEWKTSKQ